MALAPQSVYVAQARQVQALWARWQQLYYDINRINQLTTKNGAQNVWKAMPTAAQNADGSLGSADPVATPVNTHPITTPDAAGNQLGMAANDIINVLNDMILYASVHDGTNVAIAANAVDHRGDGQSVSNLTS